MKRQALLNIQELALHVTGLRGKSRLPSVFVLHGVWIAHHIIRLIPNSMINGVNSGVDSFILSPVLTSQCLKLKNHCCHSCGQISGQWVLLTAVKMLVPRHRQPRLKVRPASVWEAMCARHGRPHTQGELRLPVWWSAALEHPDGFIYKCVQVLKQKKRFPSAPSSLFTSFSNNTPQDLWRHPSSSF